MKRMLTAAVLSLLIAAPALAATSYDTRDAQFEARLQKQISAGRITEKEAENLRKKQAKIDTAADKALKNGKLSDKERARLDRMQDRQRDSLRKQAWDKQTVEGSSSARLRARGTESDSNIRHNRYDMSRDEYIRRRDEDRRVQRAMDREEDRSWERDRYRHRYND
jgi:Skp family chaperone for outer membrane proteins